MAELPDKILKLLATCDGVSSIELAERLNADHQKIVGAVKSLHCHEGVIETTQEVLKSLHHTAEAMEIVTHGSHEARVYAAISTEDSGTPQKEILQIFPNAKIGCSKALQLGWLRLEKTPSGPVLHRKVAKINDATKEMLSLQLNDIPEASIADFKKRKLVSETKTTIFHVKKGPNFTTEVQKPDQDLTPVMITSGAWKTANFKPYNLAARGVQPASGHLHPLLKVRTAYRQIFLEMGFQEMPTNNYVESSFWNFDALFQPQQHPARDAHDTFFLSEPATSKQFPPEYLDRVKKTHSEGGYGSLGYNYEWSFEEAQKNVLRTHTTAVSARMLYKLAQSGDFKPVKYFSIDRVFRNETLDATHLAEFHQIEGVVADYNLTLGNLMGLIREFFHKLGIEKLRFKPAMNPYTEPSMEVFSYHAGLDKWVELGNSGIFRPEMLEPMGFPPDVVVIAWGLSLERPTMIKYGIDNIRDLIGPKVNLQMVYDNPVCRLDN